MSVRDVDHGWKEFRRRMENIKASDSSVSVGVLGDSDTRDSGEIGNVELAMIHEFGAPSVNIPERSFLRSTFDEKRMAWNSLIEKLSKKVVEGGLDLHQALELLGQRASADVKNKITQGAGVPPPNKPETIRHKDSSRPLVDTGELLRAISYEVGEKSAT